MNTVTFCGCAVIAVQLDQPPPGRLYRMFFVNYITSLMIEDINYIKGYIVETGIIYTTCVIVEKVTSIKETAITAIDINVQWHLLFLRRSALYRPMSR